MDVPTGSRYGTHLKSCLRYFEALLDHVAHTPVITRELLWQHSVYSHTRLQKSFHKHRDRFPFQLMLLHGEPVGATYHYTGKGQLTMPV